MRVDLEGGQHHLLGVVAQDGPHVGWVVVQLQVQQEAAAAGHRQELGAGLGVWAGLMVPAAHAFLDVLLGVVDHVVPQGLCEFAAGLHAAHQVGHHRCERLDLGHLGEPSCRVGGLDGFALGGADRLGDVVVTGLAQPVLGAEVMDHQARR